MWQERKMRQGHPMAASRGARTANVSKFRCGVSQGLRRLACTLLAAFALTTARAEPQATPDKVFLHGKIVTLDAAGKVVQAVAVRNGKVLATGPDARIRKLVGATTEVVDLHGRTVLPGFVDGHAHPSFAVRMIEHYLDGRIATTPSVAVLLDKLR